MSDNPLDPSPAFKARVEKLAKELWQADGSPDGRMDEYRERADELARMEAAGPTGLEPNPINTNDPIPGVIVEEASIQQNLGEFPGGSSVADQGEYLETPMTREELQEGKTGPGGGGT